ncbi:hypothetical protein ACFC1I_06835 [Microbacterium sp. NPDC056044]|uniref:hypothetical protein n=1 Tax=Microbacterium sp. NPDC056044 TaxID=3345690 RepID=UPI0035E2E5CA
MTRMLRPDAEALLRDLLARTAEAHGRFETEELGGVYDEAWPAWYAAFMARTLEAEGFALERSG